MTRAVLETQGIDVPTNQDGETYKSDKRACFEFTACNTPGPKITSTPIRTGSRKVTIEGKIQRDITSNRMRWEINFDYMNEEQFCQLKKVYDLVCGEGFCSTFNIVNDCSCCDYSCDPVGVDIVSLVFGNDSRFGGREGVKIVLEESSCAKCS